MTPVPRKDKDTEARAAAPSEVTYSQLTPEERERLEQLPKKRITNRYGERRREPVVLGSYRRLHAIVELACASTCRANTHAAGRSETRGETSETL